jgi:hypothetical protein
MDTQLILANICRMIARIGSVLVILLGVPFLLFVGLQLFSGGAANSVIFLSLLFLVGILAGSVIAWWKEDFGAAIIMVSLIGSFSLSGALLPGVGTGQGFSLFVGPINLLFAILFPGYHPEVSPSAKFASVISWVIPIIPVVLFFASWLLRRGHARNAKVNGN